MVTTDSLGDVCVTEKVAIFLKQRSLVRAVTGSSGVNGLNEHYTMPKYQKFQLPHNLHFILPNATKYAT